MRTTRKRLAATKDVTAGLVAAIHGSVEAYKVSGAGGGLEEQVRPNERSLSRRHFWLQIPLLSKLSSWSEAATYMAKRSSNEKAWKQRGCSGLEFWDSDLLEEFQLFVVAGSYPSGLACLGPGSEILEVGVAAAHKASSSTNATSKLHVGRNTLQGKTTPNNTTRHNTTRCRHSSGDWNSCGGSQCQTTSLDRPRSDNPLTRTEATKPR